MSRARTHTLTQATYPAIGKASNPAFSAAGSPPASATPTDKQSENRARERERAQRKITVRSHTQAIYFYPTMFVAFLAGIYSTASTAGFWGSLFLPVFFANLLVVMFSFNSLRTLLASMAVVLTGFVLWNTGLVPGLTASLAKINPQMNTHFYLATAIFLLVVIISDFIWAHLNRWEFSANEIKHIQAFAGHTANFPGKNLRFQVRTVDVFERLLLGAGTLVLLIGKRKVRIPNVVMARLKIHQLERFIRSTGVFGDNEDVFEGDADGDDEDDNI